jgi:hypothetical protein
MRRTDNEGATGPDAPRPAPNSRNRQQSYMDAASRSSGNLQEQIGILLWWLQTPISRMQIRAGFELLEILLLKRYGRGAQ